jgi:two-component system, chemotaxis family, protein-glutamate methylesterase/glutaminase
VEKGGAAVVQDPVTAEVPTMPAAALRAVPHAEVLPLERIAEHLVSLRRGSLPARQRH